MKFRNHGAIPALRYDHFKTTEQNSGVTSSDGATSPKLGLSYKPVEWLMLYGNYAEAFRAPSFNETFADGVHFRIPLEPGMEATNFFIPNPGLLPETSETWEFGGGLDFKNVLDRADRVTVKGGYFRSSVKNLIDLEVDFSFSLPCFAPVPGPCTAGTSRNINTRNARLDGFELTASYDHTRVYLDLAYSTVDGKDRDSGAFVGILTPDLVTIDGGLKIPEIDARIGTRIEIASKFDRVNDPSEIRAGYEVVDLYFVWAPADGPLAGLRLDLGIDNLTDASYERVFANVPAPGINPKVGLSWTGTF